MSLIKPILGLEDAFGNRAKALRTLQFKLYDIYSEAGFSEVIPPLVERPESLNSGAGSYLSSQTVVFSDPAETGLLAIRPDMTPQIARIAATRLLHKDVLRIFYSGQVMLARPDIRSGSRQQWQTGVECIGLAGVEGDVEVMHLAALSMASAGFKQPILQIGHMGVIDALTSASDTPLEAWVALIARHSPEDMSEHLKHDTLPESAQSALFALASGQGNEAWLQSNKGKINAAFDVAADQLIQLVDEVQNRLTGEVSFIIDVAVTPRFLYHNGMVFSGFALGSSTALLHGGRYDSMMAAHGRDMPAVGFSFDLWSWLDNAERIK